MVAAVDILEVEVQEEAGNKLRVKVTSCKLQVASCKLQVASQGD